mmetsp:Transcript_44059/g.133452  ORF Transcript_44059/g.133452 Transcript_44059/m.133452 type:complete len:450 (-) Transcript_44059:244-1593(-)
MSTNDRKALRHSLTVQGILADAGQSQDERLRHSTRVGMLRHSARRVAQFLPLGLLAGGLAWSATLAAGLFLFPGFEEQGMTPVTARIFTQMSFASLGCAMSTTALYKWAFAKLDSETLVACFLTKALLTPLLYWHLFADAEYDCLSGQVLMMVVLAFNAVWIPIDLLFLARVVYSPSYGMTMSLADVLGAMMRMGICTGMMKVAIAYSLVMFLKYLHSLAEAPKVALSVAYPVVARAMLFRCVKAAYPFEDEIADGHLHSHQIALVVTELIGEFLAKQSAYIAGELPEIALVLVLQSCSELASMWAMHAVFMPAKTYARNWWLQHTRTDDPSQVEPLTAEMSRRDVVLEAYMYDVRNSVEYVAHSCMPICLVAIGADPWMMSKAWAMGVGIEIVSDLVGSQGKRLVNPCVVGVYTFDWSTELILATLLCALNLTNISTMQRFAVPQWSC